MKLMIAVELTEAQLAEIAKRIGVATVAKPVAREVVASMVTEFIASAFVPEVK